MVLMNQAVWAELTARSEGVEYLTVPLLTSGLGGMDENMGTVYNNGFQ